MSAQLYGRRTAHNPNSTPSAERVYDFVDGQVVENRSIVATLCSVIAAQGASLTCTRCQNPDEPIAAIVIVESMEQAWLACAECSRELPRARLID